MYPPSRKIAAVATSVGLALTLASCAQGGQEAQEDSVVLSSWEAAVQANEKREVDDKYQRTPQVLADADRSGRDVIGRFFDKSGVLIATTGKSADQLQAASLAVALRAPVMAYDSSRHEDLVATAGAVGATTLLTVGNVTLSGELPEVEVIEVAPLTGADSGFAEQSVATPKDAAAAVAGLEPGKLTALTRGWDAAAEAPAPNPAAKEQAMAGIVGEVVEAPVGVVDEYSADQPIPGVPDGEIFNVDGNELSMPTEGAPEWGLLPDAEQSGDAGMRQAETPAADATTGPAQSGSLDVKEWTQPAAGGNTPRVIAAPTTSPLAVANARAYGATVHVLPYADPRVNEESLMTVAGLDDGPLIALGEDFGSDQFLAEKIAYGSQVEGELPGGGQLVFPGRRMIAFYGHPSGSALGVMGEQPPVEAVERLQGLLPEYQALEEQPVIPAFEIIGTVASSEPGPDGNFSNEFPESDLEPYVDAVTAAGGYVVIDVQPGRARMLEQAKLFENLLKRPNVGLALDSEWKIGPEDLPGERVGSVEAEEVNEVADWLATFTRENKLPQKAFVLHQFQLQMLRDREQINVEHPELAFVLHADGHGNPGQKMDTWNVLRQDLAPQYFMAWKNFYDEDDPMFTPEQTFAVEPRPWFVSYQ